MTLIITILASLISVVNPLGAVPVFLSLTPDYTKAERNHSAMMTSIYFTIILLAFFWGGTYILSFFGVSIYALRIAGGIVIMMSGFGLLQGKFTKNRVTAKVREEAMEKDDISFTPMAMPMLSGPGSISLLIGHFTEYPETNQRLTIAAVIALVGFIIYMILRLSPLVFKVLGVGGLKAISRIMGFIVIAISIEYIISGVVSLVASLAI